ncbi:MAG: glycosyltransferase family 2 protein [Vicinamibacteria bacterium]|nr:glycosyltransferase family 2 protein [Vicinamibacteria bacterium]
MTGEVIDCSVVIVHYHAEEHLVRCLDRLEAGCRGLHHETFVFDNSRTLDATEIALRFPDVRCIVNAHNVGFARAANQGIEAARGRNILLLNPDATTHENAVTRLVRYLDRHQSVGAVGPRLLDPDGRLQYSCRRFPGCFTIFFGRYAFLTKLLPRNPGSRHYLYLDWDHNSERDVDWLSGACLLMPRRALDAVGPLDPRFFLFVEDMDWCRRVHDAGMRVVYLPDAVATHAIGASRETRSASVIRARHRGMWLYYRKHLRRCCILSTLVMLGLALRAAFLIVTSRLKGNRREPCYSFRSASRV